MGKTIGTVTMVVVGVCLLIGLIYGGYWTAKTVSYKIFYSDMVEQTIKDMVRQEVLK